MEICSYKLHYNIITLVYCSAIADNDDKGTLARCLVYEINLMDFRLQSYVFVISPDLK